MRNLKRLTSLFLAICLILAVAAGCAPASGTTTQPDTGGSQTTTSGTTPAADLALEDYTEMITPSVYFATGTASPPDPVNNKYVSYVRDKFKIDMSKSEFVTSADTAKVYEKLGLMISSGTMPDIISLWLSADAKKIISQFADAGMILDVEPYIEQYMPNLQVDLNDEILNNFRDTSGKLYMIPSFAINADNKDVPYTMEPNLTLVKRTDVWESLGITENPKTPDEFYEILKKLKTVGPVNGKEFIPFQGLAAGSDFEMLIGGMFGIWRHRMDVNEQEQRFIATAETPEYLDYLKYGAKLYREGLMDPELFVNSSDVATTRFQEGRVGSYVTWPNEIDVLTAAAKQADPNAMYNAFPLPKAAGVDSTEYWQTSGLGGLVTIVSSKAADPERLVKFLDWQMSTEGWIASCYGGPGADANDGYWHIGSDGSYNYNTDFLTKKLAENPSYQNECGGWVYFLVGRLIYHVNHQGFANITESPDPQRMEAREYNLPEVYMNADYEKLTGMPAGPVELAKGTAVLKVFTDGPAKIITTAKNDAEVEQMYAQMLADAQKAGNSEMLKERYERWQLYKDGKLAE